MAPASWPRNAPPQPSPISRTSIGKPIRSASWPATSPLERIDGKGRVPWEKSLSWQDRGAAGGVKPGGGGGKGYENARHRGHRDRWRRRPPGAARTGGGG